MTRLCLSKRGNFPVLEKWKKCGIIWWHHKNLFLAEKSKNIHTFPYFAGIHLSRVSWIISKFGIEMPATYGYVTERVKILDNFLTQTRVSRSQTRAKKISFLCFVDHLVSHLIPITTKTGTEIKHYHICINPLETFCLDLHYFFQDAGYVGN